MKNKWTRKIISIFLALTLVFGATLALSSCSLIINSIMGGDDSGDGGGSIQGDGSQGGTQKGDDENLDFFPIDENVNLENLTSASTALLSAVKVVATFELYDSYGSTTLKQSEGSGVIYKLDKGTGDAYIITNYHVVYDASAVNKSRLSEDISLYLYGQESDAYKIEATCLGGSMNFDIAVLRVSGSDVLKNSYARAATLGDSDKIAPLDSVVVIGNPEMQGISVTEGIVSLDSEMLAMRGADGYTAVALRVMRVSAAINKGNSGGGLFDAQGRLVGIVVAKKSSNISHTSNKIDVTESFGYALPINSVVTTAEAIIFCCDGNTKTTLYLCDIGLAPGVGAMGLVIDSESGKIFKAEKVIVEAMSHDSIFAGKVGVGDVINSITVDGVTKTVTRTFHVTDHLRLARVGGTVSFNITRGDITFETEPLTLPASSKVAVK